MGQTTSSYQSYKPKPTSKLGPDTAVSKGSKPYNSYTSGTKTYSGFKGPGNKSRALTKVVNKRNSAKTQKGKGKLSSKKVKRSSKKSKK